jgi:hypothetical protein
MRIRIHNTSCISVTLLIVLVHRPHICILTSNVASVTFWYGSGSSDPYIRTTDPDSAISSVTFKMAAKNYFLFCLLFLKLHLHHFSKKKIIKKSQGFFFLLFLLDYGRNPEPHPHLVLTDPDPGGRKTYGSGSSTLINR